MLFAIVISPLVAACQLPLQPFTSSCKANEEISTNDRETVNQVALKFVQDALGPDHATALQLADRGPFFQLGIRPEIEKEIGAIKRPGNLEGQAPFVWNFGKSTFKVLNVGPIGISGKMYLLIDHEIEPWAEDKEADRKNRDLLTAFAGVYPEYRDVFAGLVVRAHERGGNRGFGTVDENQK